MDETQCAVPVTELANGADDEIQRVIEHEEVGDGPCEEQLLAHQIAAMKEQTYAWQCWMTGCAHKVRFPTKDVDAVPFLIVHHFVKDHKLAPGTVTAVIPEMADEVRAYRKATGIETPGFMRTGVSTNEMGTLR